MYVGHRSKDVGMGAIPSMRLQSTIKWIEKQVYRLKKRKGVLLLFHNEMLLEHVLPIHELLQSDNDEERNHDDKKAQN